MLDVGVLKLCLYLQEAFSSLPESVLIRSCKIMAVEACMHIRYMVILNTLVG